MVRKKLKPLEYAFWLLKLRDRSIGEMEEKFGRKDFSKEEISKTITLLIEKDFLNDQRFAQNFVRFRKSIKPTGKYYLQKKLYEKKIPKEIIENILNENLDQESEIEEAADHWIIRNKKVPKEKIYEKLSRHLVSRGFEWEKIRDVVLKKVKN